MRFLLVFTMAVACLNGITSFPADLGDSLGSSRKLQEPDQGTKVADDGRAEALVAKDQGLQSLPVPAKNNTNQETVQRNSQQGSSRKPGPDQGIKGADDGRAGALVTKHQGLHSFPVPAENNTSLETVQRNSQKSKHKDRGNKDPKGGGKVVVKRNSRDNTTTITSSVDSSLGSTHAPAQVTPISSQQPILVASFGHGFQQYQPAYHPGFQPEFQPGFQPVQVIGSPQATQKTEEAKKPDSYDYTNILAIVSGGGFVSVAKAIQTFFFKKKEKKEKQKKNGKKGKRQKKDSESSHSDSGSEAETEPEPGTSVAVHIEMKPPKKVDPAKKKIDSATAEKKTDSVPAITD